MSKSWLKVRACYSLQKTFEYYNSDLCWWLHMCLEMIPYVPLWLTPSSFLSLWPSSFSAVGLTHLHCTWNLIVSLFYRIKICSRVKEIVVNYDLYESGSLSNPVVVQGYFPKWRDWDHWKGKCCLLWHFKVLLKSI